MVLARQRSISRTICSSILPKQQTQIIQSWVNFTKQLTRTFQNFNETAQLGDRLLQYRNPLLSSFKILLSRLPYSAAVSQKVHRAGETALTFIECKPKEMISHQITQAGISNTCFAFNQCNVWLLTRDWGPDVQTLIEWYSWSLYIWCWEEREINFTISEIGTFGTARCWVEPDRYRKM